MTKPLTHSWPVLGKLSAAEFLKKYWQKKPLLIRKAFNPFPSVIDADELAGMCGDARIESRLIIEKGGKGPWELRRGPFAPKVFSKLPKSHWTFLVNGVDRFIPGVNQILDQFSFIPFWRIDDVMMSYAVDKGNVGAHVDNFDVFLVQVAGRREWMIEETPRVGDDFKPQLAIRLLKKFKPTQKWILEPGDMLYLPPRFPHHGVARGTDCVTMSVGFRAPTISEIVNSVTSTALSTIDEKVRMTDPDLVLQNPGEISSHTISSLKKIIQDAVSKDDFIKDWFGRFATEPYNDVELATSSKSISAARIGDALKNCSKLVRAEGARIAYILEGSDSIRFFVNGEQSLLKGSASKLAQLVASAITVNISEVVALLKKKDASELLVSLLNSGVLIAE